MSEYSTKGYYYDPGCLFQLFGDSSALFTDEYQAADNVSKQSKFVNKLLTKIGETQTNNNHSDDVLNNYETVTFPWPQNKVDNEKNIPIAIIPSQKKKEEQYIKVSIEKSTKKSPTLFSKDDNYINLSPPSPMRRVKSVGNYLISLPKRVEQAKKREQLEAEERRKLRKKFETLASGIEIVENGVKMVWTHDGRKVSEEQLLTKMTTRKSSYIPPNQYEEKNMTTKKEISVSKLAPSIDKKCQIFVEAKREYIRKEQQERIDHQMWWKPKPKMSSTFSENGASALPPSFVTQWPEYSDNLENDDVILSVEYCRGCELHSQTTRHNESQYYRKATQITSLLSERIASYAVRLKVLLKPISLPQFKLIKQPDGTFTRIRDRGGGVGGSRKDKDNHPSESKTSKGPDTSHRVGAFEIQLAVMDRSKLITHILHSKINSGNWPQIETLYELCENMLDKLGISRLDRPLRPDEFKSITGTDPIFDGRFRKKVWESPKAEQRQRENVEETGKTLSTVFLTNMSTAESQQFIVGSKAIESEQVNKSEAAGKMPPIVDDYHNNSSDINPSKVTVSEISNIESKDIAPPFKMTTTTTTTTTTSSSSKYIIENHNLSDATVSIIGTSDQQEAVTANNTSIATTTFNAVIDASSGGRISNSNSNNHTTDSKEILSSPSPTRKTEESANSIDLHQSERNHPQSVGWEARRTSPSDTNTPLATVTPVAVTSAVEGESTVPHKPPPPLLSDMKATTAESGHQVTMALATSPLPPSERGTKQESSPQHKIVTATSSSNINAKPFSQPSLSLPVPHPFNAPGSPPSSSDPLNNEDNTTNSSIEIDSHNSYNVQAAARDIVPVAAASANSTSNTSNTIKNVNNEELISDATTPNVTPAANHRINFVSSSGGSGSGSGNQLTAIPAARTKTLFAESRTSRIRSSQDAASPSPSPSPVNQQRGSRRGSTSVSRSVMEAAANVSTATTPVVANDSRQVHLSSSIRRGSKDSTAAAASAARSGSIVSVASAKSTVSKSSPTAHHSISSVVAAATAERRPSTGAATRRGSGRKSLLLPSITTTYTTSTTKSTDATHPQNTTVTPARNLSVSSTTKRKISINSQLNKILFDDNHDTDEYADNTFEEDGEAPPPPAAAAAAAAAEDDVDEDLYHLDLEDDSILGGKYSDVDDSQTSSDKSDIFKKYDMLMARRTR